MGLRRPATLRPQPVAERRVAREPPDRRREARRVPRGVQQGVGPVAQVLRRPARARRHDGAPDGHGLERHEAPRLLPLDGEEDGVGVRVHRGHAGGRRGGGERDAGRDAVPRRVRAQPGDVRRVALAHDVQPRRGGRGAPAP